MASAVTSAAKIVSRQGRRAGKPLMRMGLKEESFDQRKKDILAYTIDKSPKGSIDTPVIPLLNVINECTDLVTTSSCSGRVAVYVDAAPGTAEKVTKGGTWLSVTHDPLPTIISSEGSAEASDKLWSMLFPNHKEEDCSLRFTTSTPHDINVPIIYFKFEPFILHVLARTREAADALLTVALACGFANSGIQNRMVQIRGSLKIDAVLGWLDVPEAAGSDDRPNANGTVHLFASKAHVEFLSVLANAKFAKNQQTIDKFKAGITAAFSEPGMEALSTDAKATIETKEERKERKQREGLALAAKLRAEKVGKFGNGSPDEGE
ncbi:methyltransferase TYW3-domain-containing protein [Fimicolochytrium jonesii]|uniref:methyltransferase TYW3-domain-containing protein n=1 Tax=Fimicolochytrium jonesii TaxID=1396493 RepID=UPI0022FDD8B4|nr:methyltransferase TYW3-domain-containing protein [Fimicolochytrium jonesii]KAI8825892.1 methyltransferase TYW3-domain-containing protein [Fimicolochytrium jonesii]